MRGSGITTSSLILKALVWREIAAVRERSSQKLLALLGADRDEALGAAGVGHAHDLGGGGHHRVLVVADDVADQHHLGPAVARALVA
jgi:hypothetical protein